MADMLKQVLMAAYHFPPTGGSGVQRPLKFARYLPQFGWRPIMLCADEDRYPLRDESLVDELPPEVLVHRHAGWEPASLSLRLRRTFQTPPKQHNDWIDRVYWRLDQLSRTKWLPEPEWLWAQSVRQTASRLVRRHAPQVVWTTGGPFTTHLVGLHLSARFGIPWVADFRDPLVSNIAAASRSSRQQRYWKWLESAVVRQATRVVVTCAECGDDLLRRHPDVPSERMLTITNGFDLADFNIDNRTSISAQPTRGNAAYVVTHVGSLYQQQSIKPMLEAFRIWLARRPELVGQAFLRLVGSLARDQRELITHEDERFVWLDPYRSHSDAINAMRDASLLFLTTPQARGGDLCIPAKTFEYLASGRPLMSAVTQGTSLESMLRRTPGVYVTQGRDAIKLATALEHVYLHREQLERESASRQAAIACHQRDVLTRQLAKLFDDITTDGTGKTIHRNVARTSSHLKDAISTSDSDTRRKPGAVQS